MKVNDAIWGALLLLLQRHYSHSHPELSNIPGQKVGPALFPGFIAVGLAILPL